MSRKPKARAIAPASHGSIRCAIYTRKSSDDGLEQGFNSLDAQHEACAAYIASQRHEGWKLMPMRFDDGGLSGGSLDRPGLQRLLAEIDAGRITMVVVYKIDRLTRSLADFAKLVERLEASGCSFVSVTQAFNTSSSMGRLTLNVLLSFAQFEREVTAERIRDKIAASKKKGLWMGGSLPLGYDPDPDPLARRLVANPTEAVTVQHLFALYAEHGTLTLTRQAASAAGLSPRMADHRPGGPRTTPPAPFSNGQLHYLLTNPVYRGLTRHHDKVWPGQHPAIIDAALWDKVQAGLQSAAARRRRPVKEEMGANETCVSAKRANIPPSAPLMGKVFDETGDRLTPSHSLKAGRRFAYYVSRRLITGPADPSAWRLAAAALEKAVQRAVTDHLKTCAARHDILTEPDAPTAEALQNRLADLIARCAKPAQEGPIWDLVHRVDIAKGRLEIALDPASLAAAVGLRAEALSPRSIVFQIPFQCRRRGVETRLIAGNPEPAPDAVLLRNLARAHRWLDAVRTGRLITDIARAEGVSESFVHNRLALAFLSPGIQKAILQGTLDPRLTTDHMLRTGIALDWTRQSEGFGL